jgi:tungstate transport system substrate-binding protein
LENQFEKETVICVRHVGAGTGATLKIAEKGNIDLVMVHAKSLEEKFLKDGFGTQRFDLMYNDYYYSRPPEVPAGIKGMKSAIEVMKRISEKQALFVSRGEKSGTHVTKMVLWGKVGIKPSGAWYVVYEKRTVGNVSTLKYTDQKKAYTVIDRASFFGHQKDIKTVILAEKDEALLNFISLIPVNPNKFPRVNYETVMHYVKWLTSPSKGQLIIRDFGKDKYGSALFFPNSKEWRESQGKKSK